MQTWDYASCTLGRHFDPGKPFNDQMTMKRALMIGGHSIPRFSQLQHKNEKIKRF
jgi:hypothetical protein